MSRFKKVGTGTIEYIREVGCSNDCSKTIPINNGLPLPCKEFTNLESALLRRRALEDDQLFASGFTKIVDRSAIGDDLRIRKTGIDIGEIRTEASGARGIRECKYNFEGIEIDEFEKRFYVVNTNKHLKMCPRDLIGSSLQSLVGDKMTNYDEFQDTDLADILIGAIIEKYNKEFIAKFILLAVYENEGENMHGDDGIFAKAWYAHKAQYFHTIQYSYANLVAGKSLEAIVGGKKYSKSLTVDFGGNVNMLLLDFVNWINDLKESKYYLYNASVDLVNKTVTVVSKFASTKIRLRTSLVDDGVVEDWSSVTCSHEAEVPATVLQNSMPINDVPLMFKYEEINETNFVSLFKKYLKEFVRYLHRNGFSELTVDDIKVGIDPELMLERDDAVAGKYLAGGISIDFMQEIGLADSRFYPINALNATGLFFMTIDENILVLSDASNLGNGLPGTGQVKVTPVCDDGQFGVIFDNPMGSAMEHFGVSAFNLCDSYFVTNNDLDNREPYVNTRGVLACYSDACRDNQLTLGYSLNTEVQSEAVYDEGNDETNITVTVKVTLPERAPIGVYGIGYSLSDGTSDTGITTPQFVITLPGDKTNSGLVLNVYGNVAATDTVTPGEVATAYYTDTVAYSVKLGEVPENQYCDYTLTLTNASMVATENLGINFGLAGVTEVSNFVNTGLDIVNPADWAAIEDEIEAIFPGSTATVSDSVTNPGNETDISITGVLAEVYNVIFKVDVGGNDYLYFMISPCYPIP